MWRKINLKTITRVETITFMNYVKPKKKYDREWLTVKRHWTRKFAGQHFIDSNVLLLITLHVCSYHTRVFMWHVICEFVSYSVHNDYGDFVKPKRGCKYKFSTMDELKLVKYTEFCWEMNVPKTIEMLKPEVVHYLQFCGLPYTFKNGEPSDYFFLNLHSSPNNLCLKYLLFSVQAKLDVSKFLSFAGVCYVHLMYLNSTCDCAIIFQLISHFVYPVTPHTVSHRNLSTRFIQSFHIALIIFAGRGWFNKLKAYHSDLRIPSQTKALGYQGGVWMERDWIGKRNRFLRKYSGDTVLPSKNHIFIIEYGFIKAVQQKHVQFNVLVSCILMISHNH